MRALLSTNSLSLLHPPIPILSHSCKRSLSFCPSLYHSSALLYGLYEEFPRPLTYHFCLRPHMKSFYHACDPLFFLSPPRTSGTNACKLFFAHLSLSSFLSHFHLRLLRKGLLVNALTRQKRNLKQDFPSEGQVSASPSQTRYYTDGVVAKVLLHQKFYIRLIYQ